ncbi:MAG TPA: class I SAM-dependent methyltransferase [Candidatus Krumholzibacteria bacterium]|nr:class I SAM-dependent methyltransferase [Candidatus Krumholzibacteria bacterium]
MRSSTPRHWQRFWEQADHLELEDVYGTDGRMVREVVRLGDPAGKRILEVGAGTGRDAVALARAGAEVLTLDYVSGSLHLTRKAADGAGVTVRTVCGDALGSPFADGTFDVVFHQGLLEHFRDVRPLLGDNARILRPGGHLIVDVPQTFHYYTVGKQLLIAVDRWFAGWETQFTPAQLEGHVRREGLEVVRTYGDWMVPGLWYRALRKILLTRLGLKLPMHPEPVPFLARLGERWRAWFGRSRAALYTMPTIGVVGRKPEARS